MIGGFDIAMLGAAASEDVDVLLRSTRAAWPHGVLESADGDFVAALGAALNRHWTSPNEFFVYDHPDAYESWTEFGLTDENADRMISVTVEADGVFFVVHEQGSKTHALVEDLMRALQQHRAVFERRAA